MYAKCSLSNKSVVFNYKESLTKILSLGHTNEDVSVNRHVTHIVAQTHSKGFDSGRFGRSWGGGQNPQIPHGFTARGTCCKILKIMYFPVVGF